MAYNEADSFSALSASLPILPEEEFPTLFSAVPVFCFRVQGGVTAYPDL